MYVRGSHLHWPQYGDSTSDAKHCLPDQSGYTPCKIKGGEQPTVTGTQQAPCMYVWMENASVAMGLERLDQLEHGSRFDLTGWNGLLMGVNLMRMNTLSSDIPVVPWVAYKNDTNMSPFMWMKPMANTHYCTAAFLPLPAAACPWRTQMQHRLTLGTRSTTVSFFVVLMLWAGLGCIQTKSTFFIWRCTTHRRCSISTHATQLATAV